MSHVQEEENNMKEEESDPGIIFLEFIYTHQSNFHFIFFSLSFSFHFHSFSVFFAHFCRFFLRFLLFFSYFFLIFIDIFFTFTSCSSCSCSLQVSFHFTHSSSVIFIHFLFQSLIFFSFSFSSSPFTFSCHFHCLPFFSTRVLFTISHFLCHISSFLSSSLVLFSLSVIFARVFLNIFFSSYHVQSLSPYSFLSFSQNFPLIFSVPLHAFSLEIVSSCSSDTHFLFTL